jgi:hypothetical protein
MSVSLTGGSYNISNDTIVTGSSLIVTNVSFIEFLGSISIDNTSVVSIENSQVQISGNLILSSDSSFVISNRYVETSPIVVRGCIVFNGTLQVRLADVPLGQQSQILFEIPNLSCSDDFGHVEVILVHPNSCSQARVDIIEKINERVVLRYGVSDICEIAVTACLMPSTLVFGMCLRVLF